MIGPKDLRVHAPAAPVLTHTLVPDVCLASYLLGLWWLQQILGNHSILITNEWTVEVAASGNSQE